MNEDIINMAKEVGATRYTNRHYPDRPTHTFTINQLVHFFALAQTKAVMAEREAGQKVLRDRLQLIKNHIKDQRQLAINAVKIESNPKTQDRLAAQAEMATGILNAIEAFCWMQENAETVKRSFVTTEAASDRALKMFEETNRLVDGMDELIKSRGQA